MDLALTVLLLWGLLFVPFGLVLHWIVLGEGSSVRALPLAPITGLAAGIVLLAAMGRFGIAAGETWIAYALIATSVACCVMVWRRPIPWRSRELIGAGLLLLFAVALIQLSVVGDAGDGPLGYGTIANPVEEVAAIDAAAGGAAGDLAIAREAAASAKERSIGFEQFAALTVAIGMDDSAGTGADSTWTAYGLHAVITGMIAALVTLPLFAFARARGVRWLGLIVLVPLGVTAPAIFIALANGEGAAVASVPFFTAAVFSLLTTRRDRGWWAMVVLYGAAVAATAGVIALLPLLAVGATWMFLRSDTYEHLSQHDAPLNPMRTWVVTSLAIGFGLVSVMPVIASGGQQLAWTQLHPRMLDAIRSWPFAWLDSDLAVMGPAGTIELAVWLIGPALLAVAVIYAVVRNERRELGVLVGAITAALVAIVMALVEPGAGIPLYEYTVLALSPFLAALAIRAVALARENAESDSERRLAGTGPTILVVAFVVLSFAATSVTGSRMVHAPSISTVALAAALPAAGDDATTLVAAGDPWLAFIVDGERVKGGYADADAVSDERNEFSKHGTRITGYDQLLVSSSPLSSDPSMRYVESAALDDYQVRLFRDRVANPELMDEDEVDAARSIQRARSQSADRAEPSREDGAGAGGTAETGPEALRKARGTFTIASRHSPLEGEGVSTPPDRPAGLLVPGGAVEECAASDPTRDRTTCEPKEPIAGESCTDADVSAARAHDDRTRGAGARQAANNRPAALAQVLSVQRDDQLPSRPPMLGVECFEVALDADASVLVVHTRDVGLVLAPSAATSSGSWETTGRYGIGGSDSVLGGAMRTTSERGAALTWGADRLGSGVSYDFVVEGEFGAGAELATGLAATRDDEEEGDADAVIPGAQLGMVRGSADGMSSIIRDRPLTGSVSISNRAGTNMRIGRMFARPRDLPRSCDVPITLEAGAQREVRLDVPSVDGTGTIERPGLSITVLGIDDSGDERFARIAVASYLSRFGLARYTLVDWTEQFEDEVSIEGCDGAVHTETGAHTAPERSVPVTAEQLREAAEAVGRGEETEVGVPFEPEQ